jgi:hypothetical protein
MGGVRHVAPKGENRRHTEFLSEDLKERDHFENMGVDESIVW